MIMSGLITNHGPSPTDKIWVGSRSSHLIKKVYLIRDALDIGYPPHFDGYPLEWSDIRHVFPFPDIFQILSKFSGFSTHSIFIFI